MINEENGEEKFLKSNDDIPENFHQSVEFNSWESETLNLFEIKNLGWLSEKMKTPKYSIHNFTTSIPFQKNKLSDKL